MIWQGGKSEHLFIYNKEQRQLITSTVGNHRESTTETILPRFGEGKVKSARITALCALATVRDGKPCLVQEQTPPYH